jgi:3-oxoacyl-[acyl-carrier protein] reductase
MGSEGVDERNAAAGSATPTGRIALVTGAAGGLGVAICRELGRRGCSIVAWGRNRQRLDSLRQSLTGDVESVLTRSVDVADAGACEDGIEWLEREAGRLDILVNNAGAWFEESVAESTDEHWRHVLEVNVVAPVRLSRLALPLLRRAPHPRIVNIGSKNGFRGEPGLASYGVSKAAMNALTREVAAEFAQWGIIVNCLAPGVIDTESNAEILAGDAAAVYRGRIPLGRFGTSEEVAHAVGFLSSEGCTFATGSVFLMDGGQLACEPS